MKPNPDKCHLITSKTEDTIVNVENNPIKNSKYKKLLDVKTDYKQTFNFHIDEICKKAGQKMNTLSRIVPYTNIKKTHSFKHILYFTVQLLCVTVVQKQQNKSSSRKIPKDYLQR